MTETTTEEPGFAMRAMSGVSDLFNQYVAEPVGNVADTVVEKAQGARDGISNMFNEYVMEPVSHAYETVTDTVTSVKDGISNFFNNSAMGILENIWDSALRGIGSFLGGEESTLGGWFYEVAARDTFISREEDTATADHTTTGPATAPALAAGPS